MPQVRCLEGPLNGKEVTWDHRSFVWVGFGKPGEKWAKYVKSGTVYRFDGYVKPY